MKVELAPETMNQLSNTAEKIVSNVFDAKTRKMEKSFDMINQTLSYIARLTDTWSQLAIEQEKHDYELRIREREMELKRQEIDLRERQLRLEKKDRDAAIEKAEYEIRMSEINSKKK